MTPFERARLIFATGFPVGALSHGWYVYRFGWFGHPERPVWAPSFWYGLSAADFAVAALLLTRTRLGLIAGNTLMAVSLLVNWFVFDSFVHGWNWIVFALTSFGISFALATPWMWRRAGARG